MTGPCSTSAGASIDAIAALTGMSEVFVLKAMDVFRVLHVEVVEQRPGRPDLVSAAASSTVALRHLGDRLAATCGLEDVIDTSLASLDELFGHGSALLLVYQSDLDRLVTIASRGYDSGGVGSEVALGQGVIGMAGVAPAGDAHRQPAADVVLCEDGAARRTADPADGVEIGLPGLADAGSQMAAPMIAGGVLLGVLAVESRQQLAYDEPRRASVRRRRAPGGGRARSRAARAATGAVGARASAVCPRCRPRRWTTVPAPSGTGARRLRHYAVDGSTFLDDDYVIKGVAGRLLWKLVAEHAATGRTSFTNREAKLDPVLGAAGFRDNFESRLILLKRRLSERDAPLPAHFRRAAAASSSRCSGSPRPCVVPAPRR